MRKRTKVFIAVIILVLLVVPYAIAKHSKEYSREAYLVRDYLESKSYKIFSYRGTVEEYTLTKKRLATSPYSNYWWLIGEDPSPYIGKTVKEERFFIDNHPLDNARMLSLGKTVVTAYVVDEKVVGGDAHPLVAMPLLVFFLDPGEYWNLEGKTFHEIHSESYTEWVDKWHKKFGGSDI